MRKHENGQKLAVHLQGARRLRMNRTTIAKQEGQKRARSDSQDGTATVITATRASSSFEKGKQERKARYRQVERLSDTGGTHESRRILQTMPNFR
jgi:hypothetical protein